MDFRSNFVTQNTAELKSMITAVFLAMIPGIVGFGVLIAAVAIADWLDTTTASNNSLLIQNFGLFYVCKKQIDPTQVSIPECHTREKEASLGKTISALEQATRAMLIISVIIHIPGIVTAIYFGLRRHQRVKGALIPGVIFLFAAVCAVSGMGCYSAHLVNEIGATSSPAVSITKPGTSFMIGWFGAVCAIISCITSFASHAIN